MTTRRQTAVRKNGKGRVKKLNEEAFKIADEKALEIVQSLLKRAIEGHVLSARLLVELAEGNRDVEEAIAMRPLRSLALQLAGEPQWQDEPPDVSAETEAGSRELVRG